MRKGSYLIALDRGRTETHEVAITMRRMSELRKRLRYGWTKREAIAAAAASVPFELPTGVETRLDDGVQQRSVLDVLVGQIEEERLVYTKPPWADEAEVAPDGEPDHAPDDSVDDEAPSLVPVCVPIEAD